MAALFWGGNEEGERGGGRVARRVGWREIGLQMCCMYEGRSIFSLKNIDVILKFVGNIKFTQNTIYYQLCTLYFVFKNAVGEYLLDS